MVTPQKIVVKRKPFFSDSQVKRLLVQVMAVFSGYSVSTGITSTGERKFQTVPVIHATYDAVPAWFMMAGNENTAKRLPIISVALTGMKQDAAMRRNPSHVEKIWYTPLNEDGTPEEKLMVERAMPVPYEYEFEVSIWSSNQEQGFQLVEQIGVHFNPELDLQLSNSPADWTFLSHLIFDGNVIFSTSPTAPGGGTENFDNVHTYTMSFTAKGWMSPPVKVYHQKIIESVHTTIKELEDTLDFDDMGDLDHFVIE